MSTYITPSGGTSISVVVTDYSVSRESLATVHDIIGASSPLVVSSGLRLREGSIGYRCTSLTAANSVAAAHTAPSVTLTADQSGMGMIYVAERVSVAAEEHTVHGWHWVVSLAFREVSSALWLSGMGA